MRRNLLIAVAVLGFQFGFSQESDKTQKEKFELAVKEKEKAEKERDKMQKELVKLQREKKKILEAKEDVDKAYEKLNRATEKLNEEQEEFTKKLAKGKLNAEEEHRARKKISDLEDTQKKCEHRLEKEQKKLDKLMK